MSAVKQEQIGPVLRINLNRPEVHNAFDDAMIAELISALKAAENSDSVRVVVLSGEGSTFSAGADLNWMRSMATATEAENLADSLKLAELMRSLCFMPKPTIARVNGSAYGGGVGLIACCDMAIGVEGAKFSLSEAMLGLVPAVISPYVLAAVGGRWARRLFQSAEIFDAQRAERIGLLNQCVGAGELDAECERIIHWSLKCGPVAQKEAKFLALKMAGMTPDNAERIDQENAALIARLRVSEEGQAGIAAFLNKTAADWARKN